MKKSIFIPITIILCCGFIIFTNNAIGAAGSMPAQKVKGKVITFHGKDITISVPEDAQVAIGDRVTVSFMAGEDPIPYGDWKVSKINNNETVEATPVGNVEQPTINLDAYITATGKATATKNEPQKRMNADERFELARKLLTEKKTKEDIQKAVELVKQGVNEGHTPSIRGYGWLYEEGEAGYPQNYMEALRWYQKAADAGDVRALWLLGLMYENGKGVSQDYNKAFDLYNKGCDKGSTSACVSLGYLFSNGLGVERDYRQAVEFYKRGCDGGNATACTNLGWMYKAGKGVIRDYRRAVKLYKKGCDKGHALGCNNLGFMYENGFGVSIDLQRAVELYKFACDKEEARGCSNLGWAFYTGKGVPGNRNKGIELLQKGCSMGNNWGCNKVKELRK